MSLETDAEPRFEGTGNHEVDKLIANTVQRSVTMLQLLRDIATVLGLRDKTDAATMRRLKEYVKAGMRKDVYETFKK